MLTNTEIKRIGSLAQKKYRRQYNQFVIEGSRLMKAAVAAELKFDALYLTEHFQNSPENQSLIAGLKTAKYIWEPVSENQAKKMSDTVSPSGILALCPLPAPRPLTPETFPKGHWLYLDGLADPGNLGTLLRTAAWFGVINIGLSPDCVDAFNLKVVRGGMGAHFTLNLFPDVTLQELKSSSRILLGADMSGVPLNKIKKTQITDWVLVLGGEAHGLSKETRELIDRFISIPKPGIGESLNAAVAGGILLEILTAPS
ncbi:MAG: RNA methyltransferase [Candidatus Marinimicrobia bacterium]|nr:RNA methyltransferase [Candidatus Neomarinimicrobiota bacterium]